MGQTSMGHAALYCLGGYFSALLGSNLGLPFWVTIFFGILGGALGGLILGLSTMRLSGSYLAVITLAFAEVVEMVILNWNDVTNGLWACATFPGLRSSASSSPLPTAASTGSSSCWSPSPCW